MVKATQAVFHLFWKKPENKLNLPFQPLKIYPLYFVYEDSGFLLFNYLPLKPPPP